MQTQYLERKPKEKSVRCLARATADVPKAPLQIATAPQYEVTAIVCKSGGLWDAKLGIQISFWGTVRPISGRDGARSLQINFLRLCASHLRPNEMRAADESLPGGWAGASSRQVDHNMVKQPLSSSPVRWWRYSNTGWCQGGISARQARLSW